MPEVVRHELAPDLLIVQGHVIDGLKLLPDELVQCCLCSPPYWGLRDYGTAIWEGGDPGCDHSVKRWEGPKQTQGAQSGHASKADRLDRQECPKCGAKRVDYQLGMEPLHDCQGWATGEPCGECYVCHMVQVFREVRRILRKDGVLWLNLGDSYNGSGGAGGDYGPGGIKEGQPKYGGRRISQLKPKDLCGIPERVALALQADGWYWRAKPPWIKGNCMPESVTDRPTTAHENWFLFSKSKDYFFDADAVRAYAIPIERGSTMRTDMYPAAKIPDITKGRPERAGTPTAGRNRRTSDWWNESLDETIAGLEAYIRNLKHAREHGGMVLDTEGNPIGIMANTEPSREAHYASYGRKVIENQILCSTSPMACQKCGAPWERQTGRPCEKCGAIVPTQGKACPECGHVRDWKKGRAAKAELMAPDWSTAGRGAPRLPGNFEDKSVESGWAPTCSCEENDGSGKCQVLDPFNGTGTTMRVARANGRAAIGCELSPEYVNIAKKLLLTPVDILLLETAASKEPDEPKQLSLFDQPEPTSGEGRE